MMLARLAIVDCLVLAAIWLLLLPSPAHAYFDLGVGTYLIQMIAALVVTTGFSFRKIFSRKPKLATTSEGDDTTNSDAAKKL
jgi:hypothetical protein